MNRAYQQDKVFFFQVNLRGNKTRTQKQTQQEIRVVWSCVLIKLYFQEADMHGVRETVQPIKCFLYKYGNLSSDLQVCWHVPTPLGLDAGNSNRWIL